MLEVELVEVEEEWVAMGELPRLEEVEVELELLEELSRRLLHLRAGLELAGVELVELVEVEDWPSQFGFGVESG